MKYVILSADGDSKVYSVPDDVAEQLDRSCLRFCTTWLRTSPHAKKYRTARGICYNEEDFIEYLNRWVFPEEPSTLVANLGWIDARHPIPQAYADVPKFNF